MASLRDPLASQCMHLAPPCHQLPHHTAAVLPIAHDVDNAEQLVLEAVQAVCLAFNYINAD